MALSLRIDPWAPAYESALRIDDERAPTAQVDPFVETEDWRPIQPEPSPCPETVVFVDGVQRVETRLIGDEDGRLVYGAFVSIAAGAAIVRNGGSCIAPQPAQRIIALGGGSCCEPQSVECGTATLTFACESTPDRGVDGWHKAVDTIRRDAEKRLGQEMVNAGYPLVIVDGRLSFQPTSHSLAVGLSKSIRTVYLQSPQSEILSALEPGTRTPIFSIPYEHPVYSWYLRLASPRPIDHPLAGLVQVETMAGVGAEQAVRLADLTAANLPQFASASAWDPRAPQNLYPVSALEERLRHELGDHEWIRRHIEVHFHRHGVAAEVEAAPA
jgi:hypothetical protein